MPAGRQGRDSLEVKDIIKLLLKSRGLKTKKQINEFLNPSDPYQLKITTLGIKKTELNQAIKRIKKAIAQKENIIIYGDYDADGICATAVLWETLHHLGAQVMPFIPQREEHGYGLNPKGIDDILKDPKFRILGSKFLIITVDNGIVAHRAVKYAQKKGIGVIITDHHQPRTRTSSVRGKLSLDLPKAYAVIHSDKVSGAGVAWFFAKEIYKSFHKDLKGFKASNTLELACIGTITDMMPMLGINRSLVSFGLEELRKSNRPGIKALCKEAVIPQKEMDTYHLGYIIGPRLNAMGRLEEALESLRLLCTPRETKADGLALKLGSINRQRQQLTEKTFEHAKKKFKSSSSSSSPKVIFIAHESYNPGVIGLVAGKLVEEFYKPAIVVAQEKEFSKGSGRSVKGFNMIKFLRKVESGFEDLGGHPMAAGFTVKTEKIKELKLKLEKAAAKKVKDKLLEPIINIDLEIKLNDINWSLFNQIEKFSPFGLENHRPVFASRQVKVLEVRAVGRERKHLKLKLSAINNETMKQLNNGVIFNAIAFNLGHLSSKISPRDLIDICYNLEKNLWNGNKNLELRIKDIKLLRN